MKNKFSLPGKKTVKAGASFGNKTTKLGKGSKGAGTVGSKK